MATDSSPSSDSSSSDNNYYSTPSSSSSTRDHPLLEEQKAFLKTSSPPSRNNEKNNSTIIIPPLIIKTSPPPSESDDVATLLLEQQQDDNNFLDNHHDTTTTTTSLNPSPSSIPSSINNSDVDNNNNLMMNNNYNNNSCLNLPHSPSALSVSSTNTTTTTTDNDDDGTPTMPTTNSAAKLSSILKNGGGSNNILGGGTTTTWWKEKLFPRELLPSATLASSSRVSSSASNLNTIPMDESPVTTTTTTSISMEASSISSSRLEGVVERGSNDILEFSEEALLDHVSKELCSNMLTEEELEQISAPPLVDFILRDMKFTKQKCSLVHLAAKHNRVELLHWFKRCCCDKKCSYKHIPISKLLHSNKSHPTSSSSTATTTDISSFSMFENKRFSRNFGKNFNVAIRHFDSMDEDSQHSKQCIQRQHSLWATMDTYSATPLFYSCKNSLSMEATAFLLSQPSVSQKQLNHHHDQFGNLPITIGFRSANFGLCDLMVLFGAKIDVTSGILAESLLHKVCRDGGELDVVKYLAKNAPKILLKRNQRDESALFACIRDLRMSTQTTPPLTGGGSFSGDINLSQQQHRKSSNGVSDTSFNLLHNILSYGADLFGRDIFEKAILMKNSFGMNILMASILYNDLDATKVICLAFSNYCSPSTRKMDLTSTSLSGSSSGSSSSDSLISDGANSSDSFQLTSPRKRHSLRLRIHQRILSMDKREIPLKNMLKTIIFDKDKQGKTILHLSLEAAIQLDDNGASWDDMMDWFDGFQWLCLWLEQNFLQSLNNRTNCEWTIENGICNFFEARDAQNISPYGMVISKQPNEEINFEQHDSTNDRALFWPQVLEFIHTTIKNWTACEKVKEAHHQSSSGGGGERSKRDFRYSESAEVSGSSSRSFFFQSQSDSYESPEQAEGILLKMKRRFKKTQSVNLEE